MAIFRLEAKIISRNKTKGSIFREAAYCTAGSIKNDRTGKIWDFTNNENGVIQTVILNPTHAPAFATDTQSLWSAADKCERRRDAQIAREIVLSLPRELNRDQQLKVVVEWAQKELVNRGMVVEIAQHDIEGARNPHCHLLCTLRRVEGDHFSAKKEREWNKTDLLMHWRESWEKFANDALGAAGRPERIDCRSLKDQGLDQTPEPKIGPAATAMKKSGRVADPERFKLVRWIKALNAVMPWARDIEKHGEVQQHGLGKTWWERSLVYASDVGRTTRDAVMDTWAKFVNRQPDGRDMPPPDRGPDLSR